MKHKASGCYADENLSGRLAKCADLSGSDRSSLHEESDRQGVTLDDCGTGSCDGLKEAAVNGSCSADNLEATPMQP
jgi:hypothetical protein